MLEKFRKMNLQLFAESGAAEGDSTPPPEGAENPGGAGGLPEAGGADAKQPETITITQEQLDALIEKAVAKGARKGKKEARQTTEPSVDTQSEADPAVVAMEKAHALLINAALKAAAIDAGFIDPEDALAAERADIDVDDVGNVEGAAEAVKALLAKKPHFAKRKESGPAGGGVNGARSAPGKEPLGARIAKRRQTSAQRASKALESYIQR